jgi:hypothetical protein
VLDTPVLEDVALPGSFFLRTFGISFQRRPLATTGESAHLFGRPDRLPRDRVRADEASLLDPL